MKFLSIVFILFFCIQSESHSQYLNGYKYIYVPKLKYKDGSIDKFSINSKIISIFQSKGFIAYNNDNAINYKDEIQNNRCQFLNTRLKTEWKPEGAFGGTRLYLTFSLINCNNKVVVTKTFNYKGHDYNSDVRGCIYKIKNFYNNVPYVFIQSLTPKLNLRELENTGETEESLMSYYKNNVIDDVEGIYKYFKDSDNDKNTHYKIGIKKYGYKYKAIIIESGSNQIWNNGEVKFILEPSAVSNVFSCKYYMGDKSELETFCTVKNQAFLEIDMNAKYPSGKNRKSNFLKLYPSNIISSINPVSKGLSESKSWKGNGSGIIISKDGYFVTNNHVVENMNDFEVEFKYAKEIRSFHAKLVKTDPTNDLAILKIDDPNFKNLNSIPYNFYSRSAVRGTEVFALGYPLAHVMGKDIKFTDGKISSKTGYMGDITCYQTTTPIQPGNSGGPLFDHNANLLGINSSGLRKDVAENVSYTIKTNYLINLIDVLPKTIPLPSSTWIASKPLTDQIRILSNYVVLIKVR